MRYVELRRHTDNDGDCLTPQGTADAEMIGRAGCSRPYAAFVSTGAARATQMLEIRRRAAGQDETPITTAAGLRSSVENRWREAAKAAGRGAGLDAMRTLDPDLVERESLLLGSALRQVVDRLPESGPGAGGGLQPYQRGGRSGSPAGSSRRWARAKGFCWSRTAGTTRWSPWTKGGGRSPRWATSSSCAVACARALTQLISGVHGPRSLAPPGSAALPPGPGRPSTSSRAAPGHRCRDPGSQCVAWPGCTYRMTRSAPA